MCRKMLRSLMMTGRKHNVTSLQKLSPLVFRCSLESRAALSLWMHPHAPLPSMTVCRQRPRSAVPMPLPTPGRSPDHKRKATAQESPSKLIAVEEDEGDIAATPLRHAPEKRSSRSNPADLNPGILGVSSGRGSGLDGPAHVARPLRQSKKSKIQDFSEVFKAGLDMFSAQSSPATPPAANQCFFIGDEGHSLDSVVHVFSGNHTDSSSLPADDASVPLQPVSCSQAQELGQPITLTPSVQT